MATVTYNALDNEFAASTGSNVNNATGTSTFDYPPSSTTNLSITSNEGDPSPDVFSVGDTYDLTWSGNGGSTLNDAVVIRSDAVGGDPANGYAVVFEGADANGDVSQIVWSPGFDLEQWYFNNFSQGASPGFYTTDQDGATEASYVCFAAGTRIAVPGGTRAVEDLKACDMVLTLDNGPQRLLWVGKRTVGASMAMAPIEFDVDAVGNSRTMRLSPQHRILVESPKAELLFGSDQVLVPAQAFVGQAGVHRVPTEALTYVHLLFERHEIVVAEDIACESLLLGDMALETLRPPEDDATAEAGALFPDILDMTHLHNMKAARPVLKTFEASVLFNRPPVPVAQAAVALF